MRLTVRKIREVSICPAHYLTHFTPFTQSWPPPTSSWRDSSCVLWGVPPSWTPFRSSCICRLGCPTALCDALPGAGRAGSAGQTHLRTLDRSDSASQERTSPGRYSFGWTGTTGFILGWLVTNLLLLMQHDMRFEAGDAGEPFIADWAGEVGCCVRGLVECEVKLHVKRLRAVVTSVRLPRTDGTLTFFTGCVLYLQLTHSTPWKNTTEFRAYREDTDNKNPAAPQISRSLAEPQWLSNIWFGPDCSRTWGGVWFWRADTVFDTLPLTHYSHNQVL